MQSVASGPFGQFSTVHTCPRCNGQGSVADSPCSACGGVGRVRKMASISVDVPPGVDTGTRLRVRGEGEAGSRGGPPGDLYIYTEVLPHRVFQRDGDNLIVEAPISFSQAALGDELVVPAIDGSEAKFKLPEGTQTGRQFTVRGRGMPRMRGAGRGDLIVQVRVVTPTKLTERERELLQELDTTRGSASPDGSRTFFQKVKDLFDKK